MEKFSWQEQRERMVKNQLESRGVNDPLILEAMRTVPRHKFMPKNVQDMAYEDRPLPIGQGQTISQPFIVGFMTQALRLRGGEKVLEIGTGWGYQAAVLSRIAAKVYTIECISNLAQKAKEIFAELNYTNIWTKIGDGTEGWEENSPYHGIIATASGPHVPEVFKNQLKIGGNIVMPVGAYRYGQQVVRVTKGVGDHYHEEKLLDVAFVPLIGKYGWQE